jgi:hypothetical protein
MTRVTNATRNRVHFEGESDQYREGYFDVCKSCTRLNAPRPGDPEVERERRIQSKIRLLVEMRPDLNLEGRVQAAIEEEFDAKFEPGLPKAFREFLVERQGL